MQNSYNHLLSQVLAITQKYDHILRISGEEFNIFRILKLHASETRTHSAFIAELLNPKGSHGQKDAFLKLFLKVVVQNGTAFQTSTAKLDVEKHIGFTNFDKTEGGRLDICITDQSRSQIFIENKIYAGDQVNQLLRYHNYNKDATLLYLCLSDREASELSCGHLKSGTHYKIISYKKEIIRWLNECRKESVSHPLLRESITQYINLIKHLTGQSVSEDMNNEIIDQIVKDKDSLSAAFTISESVDAACDRLQLNLIDILREIASELDLIMEENIDWKRNYRGFLFYKQYWEYANITFQFHSYDKKLIYGIGRDKVCNDLEDSLTKEVFKKLSPLGGQSNGWWPFWKDVEEPFDNWNRVEAWQAILDGSIKDVIKSKVVEILQLLDEYPL